MKGFSFWGSLFHRKKKNDLAADAAMESINEEQPSALLQELEREPVKVEME